jgi:uncharacterized protein involved in exopolysaccharide biosynthesis
MIQNRELTMQDYSAMLRRRAKAILIPALLAPLAGFAVSYIFPPKYTSSSVILYEEQKVPDKMVMPVVTEDLTARVATLQQQVLSQSRLQPVVDRLFPGKSSEESAAIIDTIRLNVKVQPIITELSAIGGPGKAPKPGQSALPGFSLNYTSPNSREAQQICNELTTLFVDENLKSVQAAATGTSDVLARGLEDGKRNLDDLDAKLAAFKKQYIGQLPGDEENNLKILTGLNSQLDANTQTLNRAQQDKTYAESVLEQQLAAWKSSQSTTNPQTLERQLSDLQSKLLQLQAVYTAEHPDVMKTKADIAEVKKKLAEVNKASSDVKDAGSSNASALEPPEIRQLRSQLHQYEDMISAGTRDQKRLQQEIAQYQGRISLSPAVEEQYNRLKRDYDTEQKDYQDLLAKKSAANLTVNMNNQSQGERMFPVGPASVPDAPSFPNRLFFAGGGLGAGFALGLALALWLEIQDNSIRTEADAEAVLELPMLVAVPWVGDPITEQNGHFRFWRRNKSSEKETIGA